LFARLTSTELHSRPFDLLDSKVSFETNEPKHPSQQYTRPQS